ncbi:MAG: F0F1 ATP synthase subunit B [Actinobacteria bacterium]|nr:F0F1 ATP synthase subunit B [Actinomycetota bacterium]
MELLKPETGQMFWTAISFGVLLLVLWRFGLGPITDMLAEREKRIRESLEQAEHTRLEAERLLRDYEERLAAARAEAQNLIAEGRRLGESLRQEIVTKADEEASRMLTRAREQIARDTESAILELKREVGELSVEIASRIIDRSLTPSDHLELIKGHLGEVEQLT